MTHGNRGQLIMTSTPNMAISNLELTNTGDNLTYKIPTGEQAKRYWDRSASFVFQQSSNGSAWNTVTPSAIDYVIGRVTFASAVGGTNQARISSGAYLPWAAVADVIGWSLDVEREEHDATTMTTNSTPIRNRTWKMGLPSGGIQIERFLVNDTYVGLMTIYSDDTLIVSLVMDVTQSVPPRFECYARLKKDGMKVPLNDLEMENLDLRADGRVYLVTS